MNATRTIGKRAEGSKPSRFARAKAVWDKAKRVVGLSAIMGLAGASAVSCGDTINNYNEQPDGGSTTTVVVVPEPENNRSAMCDDDVVRAETSGSEVTLERGQALQIDENEYQLTLTDVEGSSQTGFTEMSDPGGEAVRPVDFPEGVEVKMEFPDGTEVTMAACSVRSGDTFSEVSVTFRANTGISVVEEEPEPEPPGMCEGRGTTSSDSEWVDGTVHTYLPSAPYAVQSVDTHYCGEDPVPVAETSAFAPAVQTVTGESGYVMGLPPGKHTVNVLGENYVLTTVGDGYITLSKEATYGQVNQGDSLRADDLRFQLDDLTEDGRASISVHDALGNVLGRAVIGTNETEVFNVAGRQYRVHVYETLVGYTFGAKWANMAILSEQTVVVDGGTFSTESGTYSFNMNMGPGGRLEGWELELQ